jgi:hypothetical protein
MIQPVSQICAAPGNSNKKKTEYISAFPPEQVTNRRKLSAVSGGENRASAKIMTGVVYLK